MSKEVSASPVSEKLLLVGQSIRSHIPGWKRALSDAATEAADKTPDFAKLNRQLHDPDSSAPRESADELRRTCREARTSLEEPLGDHAHLLAHALDEAAKWWTSAIERCPEATLRMLLRMPSRLWGHSVRRCNTHCS